ncbi:transmembrane protein 238-like [Centropristis striata]|uniref:transmembrane protein 238-like n=1 Tax=Centropristis striata TaxID=184440 RepID=UPI0027DF0DD6|nr:transmembrane protein 238-like [Centropristis striata]
MERLSCNVIGGCVPLFLVAVLFDVIGLILLFIGIFANLRIDGRFYGDFLIYTGALVVFISLFFWLMWYVGNVHVSEDDGLQKSSSIVQLARKLSERLSQKFRGDVMPCVKYADDEDCSRASTPAAHKASRVTWGRSTAYHNQGFEDCADSPDLQKKVEAGPEQTI